ncbi:PLP-dependent aminotransferase family protein [Solihabitans fulvus]|uniref:PLP-dependent aminotransferase family protein n=1 Tax=Solihabitans fulvus TaxID=1892852 RepID=A0A5B2WRX0_9PSEU|nr:PLP-dependent aminotransferase family protein [Solihabitans fulvus]KAA2253560.1 PLP-dependent aminotransferase family protein [Solihabitans fulvus]
MRVAPPPPAARLSAVASSPVREILALTARPGVISFAGGLPAPELFDVDGLRAAFDEVLAKQPRRALQYSRTEGDPVLRQAIADRLTRRDLPTAADDLLITTGSQQALTLIATTLLEPGDVVLVEEPSYLAALQCFQLAGARLVPVPCDEDGLDPVALAELVDRERPALLYLVPTFQNPTGRTLTAERRRAVAEVAASRGLWIVEDDPYGELRYRGEALSPIAALDDAADRTILLGTFSKIMAPGLRIGWLRAPAALANSLVVAKQAADLHTSTIDQAAAGVYLGAVDLDEHIRRLRAAYAPRREALLAGLPEALPAGSTWSDPDGGMFVWVRLPGVADASELLPRALARDVAFVPGAPFFATRPDPATLRLSFTTHSPEEIAEGLRRLGAALA